MSESMAVSTASSEKRHFGNPRKPLEPLLKEWNERLSMRNANSAETYVRYVRNSLQSLGTTGAELLNKIKSGEWNVYQKLGELVSLIKNKAPYTINGQINALRRFLFFNDVEIDEHKFQAKVMMPKSYVLTKDDIPTEDELASMFNVANPKGRVVIILGIHGPRIGEMSALKVKDLNLRDVVPHMIIRAGTAKERKERLVPLTPQAVEVLRDYVKSQRLLDDGAVIGRGGISRSAIARIIFRILDKCNLSERDETTKYHKIHVHCLRKYFDTYLSVTRVDASFKAKLTGRRNYLDTNYFRANKEMIAEGFKRVIPYLTIGKVVISDGGKVKQLEAQIDYLTKNVARLLGIGVEHFKEAYQKTLEDNVNTPADNSPKDLDEIEKDARESAKNEP